MVFLSRILQWDIPIFLGSTLSDHDKEYKNVYKLPFEDVVL